MFAILKSIGTTKAAASTAVFALGAAVALLPAFALYVHKGIAVLFVFAALAVAAAWLAERWDLSDLTPVALPLVAFVGIAAISTVWSPRPLESLGTLLPFAGTCMGGVLIVSFARRCTDLQQLTLRRAVIAGGAIGYGLLAVEYASDAAVAKTIYAAFGKEIASHGFFIAAKPAATVAALFLWPWSLALFKSVRPHYALAITVAAAAIIILLYDSGSAIVAVLAALLAVAATAAFARPTRHVYTVALVVLGLAAPWIAQNLPDPMQPGSHLELLPNSALHRVDIWRNASKLIAEAPLTGYGFDSSRMLYGSETQRSVYFLPDAPGRHIGALSEPIPLHPHNSILQVWLETGVMGAIALIAFLVALVARAFNSAALALERLAAVGLLTSLVVVAGLSFGAWQSWWLATVVLVTAALNCLLDRSRPDADDIGTTKPGITCF